MKTVDGEYTSAKIFTDNVEDYALAQIQMICDNATAAGSTIRVMPDINNHSHLLYDSDRYQTVENINPYLVNAETIFIEGRPKPICNVSILLGCV